jgi:hypothetical protein
MRLAAASPEHVSVGRNGASVQGQIKTKTDGQLVTRPLTSFQPRADDPQIFRIADRTNPPGRSAGDPVNCAGLQHQYRTGIVVAEHQAREFSEKATRGDQQALVAAPDGGPQVFEYRRHDRRSACGA